MNYKKLNLRNRSGYLAVYEGSTAKTETLLDAPALRFLINKLNKSLAVLEEDDIDQSEAIMESARLKAWALMNGSTVYTRVDSTLEPLLMSGQLKGSMRSGTCTYIILEGNFCKIGSTKNLRQRWLSILHDNHPNVIVEMAFATEYYRELETALHNLCNDYHVSGDWFHVDAYGLILNTRMQEVRS